MRGDVLAGVREDGRTLPAIVGFACNQGFIFSLFYTGENRALATGPFLLERADLLGVLLFMAACLAVLHYATLRARSAALSQPLLWCYAALAVVGSVAPLLLGETAGAFAIEGILVGLAAAMLLSAWGRALSQCPEHLVIKIILYGAALGACLCLLICLIPAEGAISLLKLLPLGSASALSCFPKERGDAAASRDRITLDDLLASKDQRHETARLSHKMLCGMIAFGLAAGIMETFGSDPGMETTPAFPASLLMFIMFVLAAAQQIDSGKRGFVVARPGEAALEAGVNADISSSTQRENPLDGMYRLAVLVSMAGFLLVPVLGSYGVPGEAIVLSGYLGLTYTLVSLFVVMSHVSGGDPAFSLARGFAALYLGEMAGVLAGNILEWWRPVAQTQMALAAVSGVVFLIAYLYLFTERDFDALTAIAGAVDSFDESCRSLAAEYGLSPRETEVLPLALKGRTGERIAAELCISKSTVDTHLRRIYQKMGVHGRQDLIDLAERRRL